MKRVCVIGGGAAGAMAALAAADSGAEVVLFARGYGATALSSGAVDVAGWPGEMPGDRWEERPSCEHNLREMIRRNRLHPLAAHVDAVPSALEFFAQHVSCYETRSLAQPDLVLPTDLGTWKSTFLAQRSQAAADVCSLEGKRVAVLGFRGWGLLRASFVAASLEHFARGGGVQVTMVPVEVAACDDDVDLPLREPIELAQRMERDEALVERLMAATAGFDVALAPAVLGIERVVAGSVCELLASDRSVPGLRLQRALGHALVNAGVEVHCAAGCVEGPTVLATGRYLGGGIVRERGEFRESVLGLPVTIDGVDVGRTYLGELAAQRASASQPFLRTGVRVDEQLRPLGRDGAVFRKDLFAAGSVIGGFDVVQERCGLGTALVTGYVAGRAAAATGS